MSDVATAPDLDSLVNKSLAGMPKADYGKAAESLKTVGKEEAAATERTANKYLGGIEKGRQEAYEKYQGIEPVDVKPWNAEQKKQQYSTDPLATFGSFWNVAMVAASAFTRQPLVNSLTASAAFINARADQNELAYEKDYKAWKDNTDLALKRHQIERESFDDALKLINVNESAGKAELAAVMAKFGMKKKQAMMDAGMFPELMETWHSEVKAYEGLSKARDEIETSNLLRQSVRQENDDRKAANRPAMSPTEEVQFRHMIGGSTGTPEQQILIDAYKKFSSEHPDASSEEKMKFLQQFYLGKYSYKGGASAVQADQVLSDYKTVVKDILPSEEATIKNAFTATGTYGSMVRAKMLGALEQIKQMSAEGNVPPAADRLKILGEAAENKLSEDSLNAASERWLQTGELPPQAKNRSPLGQALATDIQNRGTQLAKERGVDVANLSKNWQKFKAAQVAIQRFESGPQGNTARSLNVVIDHLSTVEQLAKALNNGDMIRFNQLAQRLAEETGSPIPTNMDTATRIVGAEVVKAMGIAGAGTESERSDYALSLSRAKSPAQLEGATQTIKRLLAGQLKGLRQQYIHSTGLKGEDFDEMMLPETLRQIGGKKPESDKPPLVRQNGHVFKLQPDGSYKDVTSE